MKRIIRAALIGSLVCALLGAGALLIGRNQPMQQDLFRYLGQCDGQPCYLGIAPGKTAWDSALTVLEDRSGIEFDPDTNIASNPPGFQGSALIFGSATVDEIELTMRTSTVSIGSLIVQMGSPCAVIYTTDGILALFYPRLSVQVMTEKAGGRQTLKPTSLAYQITLSDNFDSCAPPKGYGYQPWRGFAQYTS
ncbi:MAG TPA: hypothetical protein VHD90_08940 [Phototrophicaceae bacterium]|nr:hypothetical protein [Phototrophicaceae bacterium]